MKFTAVGDMVIQRRFMQEYEGAAEVKDYIMQGDARFFNLETTINREGECFASQYSGGSWLRADPECLEAARFYGFNIMTYTNNHTLDFSYEGLKRTAEEINKLGIANSGAGANLSQAAAPAYVDTPGGRVALISVTTEFNPAAMAGEQSRRVPGRPGVNGLRLQKKILVGRDDFDLISRLAQSTGINKSNDIKRAEGYIPALPEGCCELDGIVFRLSDRTDSIITIHPDDVRRVEKAIYEAQLQADYVLVSLHFHTFGKGGKEDTPEFIKEFCRHVIDMGAHAVIGHGPHLLHGMEIYKDRPVFYSLGDFTLQLESLDFAPEDFYSKYGLTSDSTMHELFKKRSAGFTRGLMYDKVMYESIIPYWEMRNGKLSRLDFLAVELGFSKPRSQNGLPAPAADESIGQRFKALSEKMGTKLKVNGNKITLI